MEWSVLETDLHLISTCRIFVRFYFAVLILGFSLNFWNQLDLLFHFKACVQNKNKKSGKRGRHWEMECHLQGWREINTGEVRKSKVKLSERENPPPAYSLSRHLIANEARRTNNDRIWIYFFTVGCSRRCWFCGFTTRSLFCINSSK